MKSTATRNSTGISEFIRSLKRFIDDEFEYEFRKVKEVWRKPVEARVEERRAIDGVEVVEAGRSTALLRCGINLSRFRVGDVLRLNRGNPEARDACKCELTEDNGTELVISAGFNTKFTMEAPSKDWVLDIDKIDFRKSILRALDLLELDPGYIFGILRGEKPQIDSRKKKSAFSAGRKYRMNPSQMEAFANAYAADNYYLIQGPPGTGKTCVLAYLAHALALKGERVLVTAATHRAINNALREIVKSTGYEDVIKIGREYAAEDLEWDGGSVSNYEEFEESGYDPDDEGLIVGGTCFAVRGKMKEVEFDTVLFDEAGQVTLPQAIASMLSGSRYIFIGDHRQMSPVIAGKHRKKWVTRSVFETLFKHAPGTMLNITYRMNEEINKFPSKRFYGGGVRPCAEARRRRLKLKGRPKHYPELLDPECPEVFAEVKHRNRTLQSPEEAEIAARVAADALKCGVLPEQIAIVAPYRAQGRLIRKNLREFAGSVAVDRIVVDTVERIQGQERDLVIISLTTSDPVYAGNHADFYFIPNRLNVAITRSRVKRIVIGSPGLFKARPKNKEHQEWVRNFRALRAESTIVPVHF